MQRRQFLKSSVSVAALSALPFPRVAQGAQWVSQSLTDDLPIAQIDTPASLDFNGDNPNRPHDILWDVEGYIAKKGGEPAASEDLEVVVVGGGVAGLTAAYNLHHKKIALIEQDPRFGGNCKGEVYKDACYSMGSAYLCEPDKESSLGKLLTELDIWNRGRTESGEETTVHFQGGLKKPFWEGASDPTAADQFKKFHTRMREIFEDADFDIKTSWAQETDKLSMDEWIEKEFKNLHPHIREYLQLYGWSSFCGSTDELSALQFLSFISAETGSLIAFPGGNAYVLHKMVQKIRSDSKTASLRSNCLVMRVKNEGDHVTVLYEDSMGVLKKVRAEHVIMACPKYVVTRLVPELGMERFNDLRSLPYRAYLVANIFTQKPLPCPSYELYCLQGQAPRSPSPSRPPTRSYTDICFGSWAQDSKTTHGVLTLYQGIAYDGARQFLYHPGSHDKYRKKYLDDITPVLSTLGLGTQDIHGIRLTRWGHALPLSRKGFLVDGTAAKASERIGNILFANQDNTMTPSFESAYEAAMQAVQVIE